MNPKVIIRPFAVGQDEDAWVSIFNQVVTEFADGTPTTRAEYDLEVSSPSYDSKGRFVAELDGTVIGTVHAELDPEDPDRVGFMIPVRVLREHRRQGIGLALARRGLESLRERGVVKVQAAVRDENAAGRALLARLGFKPCRVMSWMRRSLDQLPELPALNPRFEIRAVPGSPDSAAMLLSLRNEAMKEHYNYRPVTMEEMAHWQESDDKLGIATFRLVAYVRGEPVGYLSFSIDPGGCAHLNRKRGECYIRVTCESGPYCSYHHIASSLSQPSGSDPVRSPGSSPGRMWRSPGLRLGVQSSASLAASPGREFSASLAARPGL